jgi:hypothetical protein
MVPRKSAAELCLNQLKPQDVFSLHPGIRWAGLTSQKGEVIFSKMRSGVDSLTPDEDDQFLLQFGALIMNGVCERSGEWLGECEYVNVTYERLIQLIVKLGTNHLAITVERNTPSEELLKITKSVQALGT